MTPYPYWVGLSPVRVPSGRGAVLGPFLAFYPFSGVGASGGVGSGGNGLSAVGFTFGLSRLGDANSGSFSCRSSAFSGSLTYSMNFSGVVAEFFPHRAWVVLRTLNSPGRFGFVLLGSRSLPSLRTVLPTVADAIAFPFACVSVGSGLRLSRP